MALVMRPHSMTINGYPFVGRASTFTPRADDTPAEEALTIKAWWRIFVPDIDPVIVQDAIVQDIAFVESGQPVEAGPLYIRQVLPRNSGLLTTHTEIIAVSYRREL